MDQFDDIMLDLETLGTKPGCTVLSIGAVAFNENGLGRELYVTVNRLSCDKVGLIEDAGTIRWWQTQAPEARQLLEDTDGDGGLPLEDALHTFSAFFLSFGPKTRLWGNGADFDNPILGDAYHAAKIQPPWAPYSGRCYRTLKSFAPEVKIVREGVYHNALSDAISQARHATRVLDHLRLNLDGRPRG